MGSLRWALLNLLIHSIFSPFSLFLYTLRASNALTSTGLSRSKSSFYSAAISFFSSIMLYVLNDSHPGGQVALFGPNTKTLVPHDAYFAVYNWCDVQLSPARSRP